MSSAAPLDRFPKGQRIASRYTVASAIGEGASGVVYCATRDEDGRRVALKVIHRHLCGNQQFFKRYHREVAILKRIKGPHVVELLDFLEEDGLLVIALEHIDGSSLEELLLRRSPLDIELTIEIALQICSALGSAHAAGVVHRDLKPANVLIERAEAPEGQGGTHAPSPLSASFNGRVRVVDFGLAKVVHGEQMTTVLTEQNMIFGTPEYMAPEQVRGDDVDPRSDLYSLGCMLYEMSIGHVPFKKRTAIASMTAHLTEEPPMPRSSKRDGSISAHFEAVILRALAKSPAERYPSAEAFADALRACREHRVIARAGRGAADSLSRTDLDLGQSSPEHAAIDPVGLTPGQASSARALSLAGTLPVSGDVGRGSALAAPSGETSPGNERPRASTRSGSVHERVLWIVVAVVFATLGVAIGTVFGTR